MQVPMPLALNRLGPHAPEPGSPEAKPACIAIIAPVLDRHAGIVAEQKRVAGLANHLIKAVELLLSAEDQLIERVAVLLDLSRGQDPRRLAAVGIDVILAGRSLPGSRYLIDAGLGRLALCDQVDLFGMLRPKTTRHRTFRRKPAHRHAPVILLALEIEDRSARRRGVSTQRLWTPLRIPAPVKPPGDYPEAG
jgi:hypothetical protein